MRNSLIAFCFTTMALPVFADNIDIQLPITAVTVHPSSALITRQKTVSLPAGEHQLRITGLPGNIDPARLQLAIPNNAVRMGSLEVEQQHAGQLTTEQEQRLQSELESLQDSRNTVSDKIETAKSELEFLSSLAKGDASVRPNVTGSDLTNLISTISKSSTQARERIRGAEIELRDWDKKIAQKKYELQQVKTSRVVTSTVTANLRVSTALQTGIALTYPEGNASWGWLYEARLNTDTKELGLLRQAVISQGSGEDWQNVSLTLTTADETESAETPELDSLYVDIYKPRPEPARYRQMEAQKSASPAAVQDGFEEIVVTGSYIKDPANVIASQYLVDYEIPGKTNVKANNQEKIVPIDEKQFAVELAARAVPSEETRAFLEARFTYDGDIPLQGGELQLYRDNAYIGNYYASAFLPKADIRLPFGADERIRIEIRNEEESSREGGLIRRSNIEDHRVSYELTSFHKNKVPVEVLSQLPVSKNSAIEVSVAKDATPATETKFEGKEGLLMWKLELTPQQKASVRHYYSVSYPKDSEIEYFEQ